MITRSVRGTAQALLMVMFTAGAFTGLLLAQADRGAIKGGVEDTQKASVPGAQLTLRNEATGVVANTTSASSGDFSFLDLTPGVYTLTAKAKGFQTSSQQHIPVDVGRTPEVTLGVAQRAAR